MKFFALVLCAALVAPSVFGATTKKVKKVIYDDGTTSTMVVEPKKYQHDETAFVRRIIPEVGLLVSDTTLKTSGMRVGLGAGAVADLWGQKELVLETGLLYRQQGTSNDGGTIAINYLAVPLAAKYYLNGQRANGFYFKAGFVPAIEVSASSTDSKGDSTDIGKYINSFDVGATLGVGGKISLNEATSLVLEGNYTRGLASTVDTAQVFPYTQPFSVNNVSFSFMSGVAIEM